MLLPWHFLESVSGLVWDCFHDVDFFGSSIQGADIWRDRKRHRNPGVSVMDVRRGLDAHLTCADLAFVLEEFHCLLLESLAFLSRSHLYLSLILVARSFALTLADGDLREIPFLGTRHRCAESDFSKSDLSVGTVSQKRFSGPLWNIDAFSTLELGLVSWLGSCTRSVGIDILSLIRNTIAVLWVIFSFWRVDKFSILGMSVSLIKNIFVGKCLFTLNFGHDLRRRMRLAQLSFLGGLGTRLTCFLIVFIRRGDFV